MLKTFFFRNSGAGAPLPGGIKQLLSQARAAAENEKMYQKSKQNQSNGVSTASILKHAESGKMVSKSCPRNKMSQI